MPAFVSLPLFQRAQLQERPLRVLSPRRENRPRSFREDGSGVAQNRCKRVLAAAPNDIEGTRGFVLALALACASSAFRAASRDAIL